MVKGRAAGRSFTRVGGIAKSELELWVETGISQLFGRSWYVDQLFRPDTVGSVVNQLFGRRPGGR